jgi:hypothetical protein
MDLKKELEAYLPKCKKSSEAYYMIQLRRDGWPLDRAIERARKAYDPKEHRPGIRNKREQKFELKVPRKTLRNL